MSRTTQTALAPAWWLLSHTCACSHMCGAYSSCGYCLRVVFASLRTSNFVATIHGWQLFEGGVCLKKGILNMWWHIREEIPCGVTVRGEGGVAGEGRLAGESILGWVHHKPFTNKWLSNQMSSCCVWPGIKFIVKFIIKFIVKLIVKFITSLGYNLMSHDVSHAWPLISLTKSQC